jgi:hypothetical protein
MKYNIRDDFDFGKVNWRYTPFRILWDICIKVNQIRYRAFSRGNDFNERIIFITS